MDKMLFIAMNGAGQAMKAQNSISHNLANANTVGFKADLDTFTSWHVEGPGYNTRVYSQLQSEGNNLLPGSYAVTDRELDVAVQGDGWLAVQASDGNEAYTRAGDFRLDTNGRLTTGGGFPVIGNSGPIVIPQAQKIEIGADGSISIIAIGQTSESLAIVDRIKLVNPELRELQKGNDGLLRLKDGEDAGSSADVRIISGALEQSNVNIAKTMVNMIELSRQYEMQVNVIRTSKENADAAAQLLSVG